MFCCTVNAVRECSCTLMTFLSFQFSVYVTTLRNKIIIIQLTANVILITKQRLPIGSKQCILTEKEKVQFVYLLKLSPVVRACGHGAMGRRIDHSWWTH